MDTHDRDSVATLSIEYTMPIEIIEFFPKRISLNSVNSVNHDKIQKWYGYQRYCPSGNKYTTSAFSLLSLGRYPLPFTTLIRHQPTDSSGKFFFTTTSSNVSIVRYRMSLNSEEKSFRENSNKVDYCHEKIYMSKKGINFLHIK